MAQWMGMPYEAHYPQRAERYLAHEIAVMQEIVADLTADGPTSDVVIDTTGSVIYVPEATILDLRRVAQVVYLAPPVDAFQTMLANLSAKSPACDLEWGLSARGGRSPPSTPSSAAIPNCSRAGIVSIGDTAM